MDRGNSGYKHFLGFVDKGIERKAENDFMRANWQVYGTWRDSAVTNMVLDSIRGEMQRVQSEGMTIKDPGKMREVQGVHKGLKNVIDKVARLDALYDKNKK